MRGGRLLSPRPERQAERETKVATGRNVLREKTEYNKQRQFEDQPEMNGKVKFRIGDLVYHKSLNLGRGRVRYIYRAELLVAFESSPVGRYLKEDICKSEPHPLEMPQLARFVRAA
jgi:hypothetical protein